VRDDDTPEVTGYRAALRRETLFIATWVVLAAAFAGATVLAFTPFNEATALRTAIASLPPAVVLFLGARDLGRWSGFVDALLFGLLAPIAFLSFAIGFGTRAGVSAAAAVADKDGDSIARNRGIVRLASSTLAALVSGCVLLGVATVCGAAAAGALAHEPIAFDRLISAVGADLGLGVAFGALGLLIAMVTGRVGLAALLATIAAIAADTLNGIALADPTLRPLRYLSLVYYAEAGRPIAVGVTLRHLAVLGFVAITAVGVAVVVAMAHQQRRIRAPTP
jgi:hypothetical protein